MIIISSGRERESDEHQREDRLRKKRDDKVRQKSKKGPSSMIMMCPFTAHSLLGHLAILCDKNSELGGGRK